MKIYSILILFIAFFLSHGLDAQVRLNALFSDGMVLQQKTKVPVWGWANPGEKVIVSTSWGQETETVAGADSTWMVKVKTPKAGGPFQLTVSGTNTIEVKDVLCGEVWLCTGQSNMDFAMSKFIKDAREEQYQPLVEFFHQEIERANDPMLRHIEVPQTPSINAKNKDFKAEWRSVNPDETGKITATGYFFAKELRKHLNVPIGLVECSWGGTRIQPWLSVATYMSDANMKAYYENEMVKAKKLKAEMEQPNYQDTAFQRKKAEWIASGKTIARPWPATHPEKDKQVPATLHNGMISAIVPYAIKGAIWYQGESNSHYFEEQYGMYLKTLITSWREEWNQGDFSFYCTQLAAYQVPDERSDNGWAKVNDQMRQAFELPNTGMAVLHDIGEAKDVHPHNKMDAGKRFAAWALQNDYKQKQAAVSGPLFKKCKAKEDKLILTFKHVGTGLMVAEKTLQNAPVEVEKALTWFEIAGADGEWKKADAKIIAKNKIEVSNPNIEHPLKVRYAWSSNPKGTNLYNKEGLPAAVFSSEKY